MLQIFNLSFTYRGNPLFANLNLSCSKPEIVGIIGDNGAGKTTLLKLIAGDLEPDTGSIKHSGRVGFLRQTQGDLQNKSGGERTQIRLAALFRQNPEVLLLDEPTNNLDQESKDWLLRNLSNYQGLVLVVSHDRDFLAQVAERIIYLHDGEAEEFLGGYEKFCAYRVQRDHEQLQAYERHQQTKRKLERQLKVARDRVHKSNRRNYNKITDESRLRYNGQRMAAQNSAGRMIRTTQSKLEQICEITKPQERKTYLAEVKAQTNHNKKILEVKALSKSFGSKKLFGDLNFEVRTGERVRVTGRNGSGKSTLFQIVLGNMAADDGEAWLAPGIKIGYVSQDVVGFDLEKSFLEQSEDCDKTEVYHAATTMDFVPQEMIKPIKELSRGQMTKLAILKLILEPLDLVILDEITNHLDIRAQENIENALKNYRGAILLATHDEAFAREVGFTKDISL